jgi:hypothetical protein
MVASPFLPLGEGPEKKGLSWERALLSENRGAAPTKWKMKNDKWKIVLTDVE